jgi:hypothetical protein
MKTPPIAAAAAAAAAIVGVVFYAAPFQGTPQPLCALFPSGPLLYLEAKDFGAEVRAWNGSGERSRWLASARYQGFQRSNLFLKLQAAWREFADAAAFVPDQALVESLAGTQSALAMYDIGNLQFLYVTRLPSARAIETALWQSRFKYETRHAGGVDFFVRVEAGRTVAFASAGGYLILGTREELVAGALRLLAGESLSSVAGEAWYADTTAAAGAPGDLRLAMNLEALLKTPQYRSYWIQRNASEVRAYRAGIADLVRGRGEIREERVFLRKSATPALAGNAEALLRLAPASAALCRSSAKPSAAQVASLVEQKLLAPRVAAAVSNDYAPAVDAGSGVTGAESDIETRIDEPPLAAQSAIALDDLRRLLESASLDAVLEVRSGEALPDGVFVETPAVLAVAAAGPWDSAAVRRALSAAAASLWTVSDSGTGWVTHQRSARTWYALNGAAPLEIAVDGNLLLLANSERALGQVLDRVDLRPTPSDAVSVALFRYQAARDDYRKIMGLLDYTQPAGRPEFFSADLWSLSDVFDTLGEVEVRVRDTGSSLQETVTYRSR